MHAVDDTQHFSIAARIFDVRHYAVQQFTLGDRLESGDSDLPFRCDVAHAVLSRICRHTRERRLVLRAFRYQTLGPLKLRRLERLDDLARSRLIKAPMAVDKKVDVGTYAITCSEHAIDAMRESLLTFGAAELGPVHAIERRDLDRSVA